MENLRYTLLPLCLVFLFFSATSAHAADRFLHNVSQQPLSNDWESTEEGLEKHYAFSFETPKTYRLYVEIQNHIETKTLRVSFHGTAYSPEKPRETLSQELDFMVRDMGAKILALLKAQPEIEKIQIEITPYAYEVLKHSVFADEALVRKADRPFNPFRILAEPDLDVIVVSAVLIVLEELSVGAFSAVRDGIPAALNNMGHYFLPILGWTAGGLTALANLRDYYEHRQHSSYYYEVPASKILAINNCERKSL